MKWGEFDANGSPSCLSPCSAVAVLSLLDSAACSKAVTSITGTPFTIVPLAFDCHKNTVFYVILFLGLILTTFKIWMLCDNLQRGPHLAVKTGSQYSKTGKLNNWM